MHPGETGFIVPQYPTQPYAYGVHGYNLKGRAEVNINNKSNCIHKVLLTVWPRARQERRETTHPSRLCVGFMTSCLPF